MRWAPGVGGPREGGRPLACHRRGDRSTVSRGPGSSHANARCSREPPTGPDPAPQKHPRVPTAPPTGPPPGSESRESSDRHGAPRHGRVHTCEPPRCPPLAPVPGPHGERVSRGRRLLRLLRLRRADTSPRPSPGPRRRCRASARCCETRMHQGAGALIFAFEMPTVSIFCTIFNKLHQNMQNVYKAPSSIFGSGTCAT